MIIKHLSSVVSSVLLSLFAGCMSVGCASTESGGGALMGDFLWKSSNESEAYWNEERSARAGITKHFHTALGEVVLALGGEDAYGVWTGKMDPALLELKNLWAEDRAATEAERGFMGNLAKGGSVAALASMMGYGGVRYGRRNGTAPATRGPPTGPVEQPA